MMDNKIVDVSEKQLKQYIENGYNEDIVPKPVKDRNWTTKNFFTQWMGVIHNIPNYIAVLGFLLLGLKPVDVVIAIALAGITTGVFFSLNGRAGAKYGIPFSMHLRSVYGVTGSKLPGFLRGVISATAWFGVQTYIGATVLTILISQIWPGYALIGGGAVILGISVPDLISFTIFWAANMVIGLSGGDILNKFTTILTPIIHIVFAAMTVWAIRVGGGLGNIFATVLSEKKTVNPVFGYFIVIAAVIGVMAAPGVSVGDFTRNAKSQKDQSNGQIIGLGLGYLVFGFMAVAVTVGGSIHFGVPSAGGGILDFVKQWDNVPTVVVTTLVFLLITISTNAATNMVPAGLQLASLFPKKINNRTGVLISGILGFLIQPWRLMAGESGIMVFLNIIGALLGPIAGVMLTEYLIAKKEEIKLDDLYADVKDSNAASSYSGINIRAYIATLVGLAISMSGNIIPVLQPLSDIAWITGTISGAVIYLILIKSMPKK
ncbi:MAG: allantoin permease [Saccharofermentanales bacterium]|jgi:allantoin permease